MSLNSIDQGSFQLLSHDKQEQIIEDLANNVKTLSNLLNDLEPDGRAAFQLPARLPIV